MNHAGRRLSTNEGHPCLRLTVIGNGYPGLTHAACMAALGHEVLALEVDEAPGVKAVRNGVMCSDPDLQRLLYEGIDNGRLRFTSSYAELAAFAAVHFICTDNQTDLRLIGESFDALAPHLLTRSLIIGRPTVPAGSAARLLQRAREDAPAGDLVDLAWNPGHSGESSAVRSTLYPDQLVFRVASDYGEALLCQVYERALSAGVPRLVTTLEPVEGVDVFAHRSGLGTASELRPRASTSLVRSNLFSSNISFGLTGGSTGTRDERELLIWEEEILSVDRRADLGSRSFGTRPPRRPALELTILMPCLNEAETVETCVKKAVTFLSDHGIHGEVVVADNGSTDGSQSLAVEAGARVIEVQKPGYGSALLGGIEAAYGKYVIMGDADDSYDFTDLMPFVKRLRGGADLVMGNRFQGGIVTGAMPALHRYLGNPVLSFIGRLFFQVEVGDFHCGLRAFKREKRAVLSACRLQVWSSPARWWLRLLWQARRLRKCQLCCRRTAGVVRHTFGVGGMDGVTSASYCCSAHAGCS